MNGHDGFVPATSYLERFESFRQSDREREAFVADLVQKYQDLQTRYHEKCGDFENEVESRRIWYNAAKVRENELSTLRQSTGSNPFAMVLLDGDGAIFENYLYAQGKDGGAEAASQLQTELQLQLKQLYPDSHVSSWNIVVNVVLNMQGLGQKLHACGIINNPNELTAFGRSFGLAQPLFNFIDVGSGKERADHKIRETLRLFLPIPQCKHIFFGPCHDNGYLPVLEPFKRDPSTSSRITLVETTPPETGFIALGFPRVKFPKVFRDTNLPSRPAPMTSPTPMSLPVRAASAIQTPTQAFVPQSAAGATNTMKTTSPAPVTNDPAASSTWATVGKNTGPKSIDIAPKKVVQKRSVVLNVDDERLDAPLPRADPGAEKRFLARTKESGKCCNSYHLTGHCGAAEYCDYSHGERLSPGEILVLKHKARSITCQARFNCRDVDCTFGHHCKFGGKGCFADNCWFSDTHYMDLEPAKRVYEDGTEEWLMSYLEKVRK